MKIIVEIEFGRYYRFLEKCDRGGLEYSILKNVARVGTHGNEHVVTILCEPGEAKTLHFLAGTICPEAVPDIATSINLARQG